MFATCRVPPENLGRVGIRTMIIRHGLAFIKEKFFAKNASLEEKTFLLVSFSGIFMSAIGLAGNLSLGLSVVTLFIPALNILIDIICITYFTKTGKWQTPSLIVIMYAIFVLFPSLWFSTGGATGSTMPFVVLIGIFVVIAFKGRFRASILAIVIVMFTTFTLLEMYYPAITTPYPDRESQYIDLALGMILSYCVSVYLAYQVLGDYEKSRKESEALVKQLEINSVTDALTGIYNRRFLSTSLDEEMRKAYDSGDELAICILDIDYFKRINDTYGHSYGDEVLVRLSACVAGSLGSDEIFGRYGGEEFLIVFKNCPLDAAVAKMNRICEDLEKIQWHDNIRVTISAGLSAYQKGVSFSKFLEEADRNLYRAKQEGRNRIVY